MIDIDHSTPELFAAMALAQAEIENATKGSTNPHFKSKYADLAEVLNTARPVLSKHGLALQQFPAFDGSMVSVTTVLTHSGGGYVSGTMSCVPAKSDAQGVGSATTYLRRYSASAVVGIAQEDDDGQSAAHDRPPVLKVAPTTGVWEAMDEESQAFLLKVAAEVVARASTSPADAAEYIASQQLQTDEKAALWTRLDSKVRTALKKAMNEQKVAA